MLSFLRGKERHVAKRVFGLGSPFARLPGHFCPIFSASNGYGNLVPDQIQWFFGKIAKLWQFGIRLARYPHVTKNIDKIFE